jgi:para-aminobenzoate synthetase / 4-amino-4-deoxychorismate lyase
MAVRLPETPFVLLDDARVSGAAPARLYRDAIDILTARDAASLDKMLGRLGHLDGLHAAGFITYEAGHALEPKLTGLLPAETSLPLLWFGLFRDYQEIAAKDVAKLLPDPVGGWAGRVSPQTSNSDYVAALDRVHAYIASGDIYQANLTLRADVKTAGHPLAIYAGLRQRARAGYGGVIWTGEDWLLSLSPELFFALQNGKITTKPMKGTETRGIDEQDDREAIDRLQSDPKQRAENLMIVDLLRNDLSRIAVPASVDVPQLFHVETYPTVHTMPSTVTAQLRDGLGVEDIVRNIYPCGSITGAPKIRAMEIIDEIETLPRNAYTGAIGRIDPNGDAAFNVAIRTLHLPKGKSTARMGLGGGIVADSKAEAEWRECLAKGEFVADKRPFDLIETMQFAPDAGIYLLERHLARLGESARAFDFSFDRHAARNELQAATFGVDAPSRIRLLLSRSGMMAIDVSPLPAAPRLPVKIAIVDLPVAPSDFRLRHKMTDRAFYDDARKASGTFEVIFAAPDGGLTEGSFTNIFIERHGMLITPPLDQGLLPGVLRAELIETGAATEGRLTPEDLTHGFFIGNALRGMIPAML